jgi:hypothetical protein
LNQPYVLQSTQLPQFPISASPVDEETEGDTELLRVDSNTSSVNDEPSSGSGLMQSPPSAGAVRAMPPPSQGFSSRARAQQPPAAMFGPHGVRFVVDIQESAHDTRIITLTRKSGDAAAFNAILDYIRPQL